tara:strand:- start:352 stop:459 length:108 start_codon:yes stop_codon:yes gene_type:complete
MTWTKYGRINKMVDTLDQIVDNYYLNAEMPNYEEE